MKSSPYLVWLRLIENNSVTVCLFPHPTTDYSAAQTTLTLENEKYYITVKNFTWSIMIVLSHSYVFQLILICSIYCTDLYSLIQDKQYNIKKETAQ